MAELTIRAVTTDGAPGAVLGTARLDGDRIEATAGVAGDTVAMLRRRSGLDDAALFARLVDIGWSNGQIMFVQ